MFQQAFGFVRLAAPNLEELAPVQERLAPRPVGSALPRARLAPLVEGLPPLLQRTDPDPALPFLNSARLGTILAWPALLRIVSHTLQPASSTKNPSPFRSTGCASRSAHPCNDAGPAVPQTRALPRYTP